jgi:hypothetical protein
MATLEELRKKRLQELQSRKDSNSVEVARQRRLADLQTRNSNFGETPKPTQEPIDTSRTAGQAFRQAALVQTAPMLGGLAGGIKGAVLGTAAMPGVGTVVGFLGGAIAGSIITKKAQDEVLEFVKGEEWKKNLDQSIAEDRKSHPYATLLGEAAPALITFKPSPTTLKQAFNLGTRAITNRQSLAKHLGTLQGKTELDALMNVSIGAGVDVSLETYQQAREGDINALRIIAAGVIGGVISDPNRLGVKMGFKPSGDAVIEEYNKYGSQTEAAKIITKGDIPVIDRSGDALFKERRETVAILRGEGEANRFTEPRILQAEKLAGTIDKDVTPDSDLNIYRLDGRDGPMRVGERVTANPFIADVYGGRINPEAVVKAGDLVRTSKGDYIYLPKDQILPQPTLPPITTQADEIAVRDVERLEKAQEEAKISEEIEARRKAEEPARLQREAEELAERQRVEAEARFREETQRAETAKIRLEEEVRKVRAETQKRIASDKAEVQKTKIAIDKKKDSDVDAITNRLRGEIDKAILEHTRRLAKATTKMQKTKENIRFKNEKAKLTAKAIKDKKAIRDKATTDKSKVVSQSSKIRQEEKDTVAQKRKEIKDIPKPKMEKSGVKPVEVKSTAKEVAPVKKIDVASLAESSDPVGDFAKAKGLNDVDVQESLNDIREWISLGARGRIDNDSIKKIESLNIRPSGPVTLYRIGEVDGTKFQSWSRIKPAKNTNFTEKVFQPDEVLFDTTAPEVKHLYREDKEALSVLENFNKIEEEVIIKGTTKAKTPTETTTKRATIGTKTVKSQSIIKNAVEEANQIIRDAEKVGIDMTTQMGTTFVEQRKISAEILAERGFDDTLAFAQKASDGELAKLDVSRSALYEILYKNAIKEGQFNKYRDDLEALSLRVGDTGSVSAQELSLQRMATANDPFRRIAQLKKAILESEKKARGSVFDKEVDDLYAKIREATTDDDINRIINDNLC